MTVPPITTTTVLRGAGAAAVAAGALFIGVQVNHPHMDVDNIATTEMAVRNTVKVAMAGLTLAGITGMYARQVRRLGVLGLVGYLLLAVGYLAIGSIAFVAGYVLPSVAETSPAYAADVIAAGAGGTAQGDIGLMAVANQVSGLGYLAGGLLFGIALVRAGVLARWAAALLSVATVSTLAMPLLPHMGDRMLAVPMGVALAGLGVSLWRSAGSVPASAPTADARVAPVGAA